MVTSAVDWSLPAQLDVDSFFVSVSVLGTGRGESIVVNICNKFVGIIDSCEELLPQKGGDWRCGVLGNLLSPCMDPVFGFVLLTHPHFDHFAGMDRLYRALAPIARRVCLFQGVTEYELINLFRKQEALPDLSARAYKFYQRYGNLLKVYEEELSTYQRARVGDATTLASFTVRDARGSAVQVNITCLAPSADDCDAFLNQVRASSVLSIGLGPTATLRQQCNRVSVVCRIDFGGTRILLGGDAEHISWNQIKEKYPRELLHANLVKISHHGSPTGVSEELATLLSKGKNAGEDNAGEDTVALVTPSFSHRLPKPEIVSLLQRHFDEVIVTREPVASGQDLAPLRLRFPTAKDIVTLPEFSKHVTTVTFDASGNKIVTAA